jgi:murein DD-endopeptidase MepM/ murein hydrolase activator NlpD
MKNRLIITVSDIKGTKSYNIHQFVKKILLSVILVVSVTLIGGFWLISYLDTQVDSIKKEKQTELKILVDREEVLKTQNELYSLKIKEKVESIEELSSKLDKITEMIGVDKDATIEEISKQTLASLNLDKKKLSLRMIPNGYPLKGKNRISDGYGYRIHPITKKRQFHRGIDFAANIKSPILATADGVVGFVQDRNIGTFGRVIRIYHNYGFRTIYGHLNKTFVKNGDIVKKGQIIGLSGNSGRSTGPHLHYEIKHGNKILNPYNFIKWDLANFDRIFKRERKVQWESLLKLINNHHSMVQR